MNKHIELVKKWLADPSSVTQEELKVNMKSAVDDFWKSDEDDSNALFAAYNVATDAFHATVYRQHLDKFKCDVNSWIKVYESELNDRIESTILRNKTGAINGRA